MMIVEEHEKALEVAFIGERYKFIVIYLDDMTVFSKSDKEHLDHLRQTLAKCTQYGLSLNPKKSFFSMKEGKLLGHIVSKEGVRIDPEKVSAILKIENPRNKIKVQSFLGKINFLKRFLPNFAEILRKTTNILKKDSEVKWNIKARESFN